jgi:aerobic carbon-monoxide dehydrogenase medium subunit
MSMAVPTYVSPTSVEEAVLLLSKYGDKAKVVAGGSDVLVQMKRDALQTDVVISLSGVRGLEYIKGDQAKGVTIGALALIRDIAQSPLIKSAFPIVAQAAAMLGTPAIRNQATVGGNLCNAAPSADMAPALIVCGATAKIAGPGGVRDVPVEGFFVGPGATVLKQHEFLLEILVPGRPPRSAGTYLKHTRGRGADLAIVGVAAFVVMDGERIADMRIALGAVAPTPIRAKRAEAILRGAAISDRLLEEAAQAAADESKPIDDVRSSAEYRRTLVNVLTKRAVAQAIEQAQLEASS